MKKKVALKMIFRMVTKGKDGYFNGPTFERPVVLTHKAKNYSDLRVLQDLTPTSHLANIAPEILSWVSNIQGMEFFFLAFLSPI